MCSTIAIGTGKSAGSWGRRKRSACGPPVETPSTTRSTFRSRRGGEFVPRTAGAGGFPRTRLATGARIAAFTCDADDFDEGAAGQHLAHDFADERGIVDHQDPDELWDFDLGRDQGVDQLHAGLGSEGGRMAHFWLRGLLT